MEEYHHDISVGKGTCPEPIDLTWTPRAYMMDGEKQPLQAAL